MCDWFTLPARYTPALTINAPSALGLTTSYIYISSVCWFRHPLFSHLSNAPFTNISSAPPSQPCWAALLLYCLYYMLLSLLTFSSDPFTFSCLPKKFRRILDFYGYHPFQDPPPKSRRGTECSTVIGAACCVPSSGLRVNCCHPSFLPRASSSLCAEPLKANTRNAAVAFRFLLEYSSLFPVSMHFRGKNGVLPCTKIKIWFWKWSASPPSSQKYFPFPTCTAADMFALTPRYLHWPRLGHF